MGLLGEDLRRLLDGLLIVLLLLRLHLLRLVEHHSLGALLSLIGVDLREGDAVD